MFPIISGIAAVLFAALWGGTPFAGAVLFSILGLCIFGKITGVRWCFGGYACFVLLLTLGAIGEAVAFFSAEGKEFLASWLLLVPSLSITFFSSGISGATRKITATVYLCLVVLLHMYAQGAENTARYFLSMEIAGLFTALYSLPVFQKRKNDA